MKLSKSKLDAIYLLSTNTNVFLAKTLPNSWRGTSDDTFLKSLMMHLERGSFIVTLFLINLEVNIVEVIIPVTTPLSSLTGN